MVKVWLAVGEGGWGREVLGSASQPPAWHLLFSFSALYPAAWEPPVSRGQFLRLHLCCPHRQLAQPAALRAGCGFWRAPASLPA